MPIPPFMGISMSIHEWENTYNRPVIDIVKEELFENGKCRSLLLMCPKKECISIATYTASPTLYYTIPKYISTTEKHIIGNCMGFTVHHVCPCCGEKFYTFLIMSLDTWQIVNDVSFTEKDMEIFTNFIKNFVPNPSGECSIAVHEAIENMKQYYFGASKVPNRKDRENYTKNVGLLINEGNTPEYYHPIIYILRYLPSALLPEILTVANPKLHQPTSKIVFK